MLDRYTLPEAAAVWSAQTRFRLLLDIEIAAAAAMAERGEVPADAVLRIRQQAPQVRFDEARINEIERTVKHDVIAFLTHVAEQIGDDARFLHLGLTSSDVIDTAFAVQLTRAADVLIAALDRLAAALKLRALEHRATACIGRSHGMHAEPTTFGLKLAGFYAEFARARVRLQTARDEVAVCGLSGPVGTYSSVHPDIEAHVAAQLGLRAETVSTQVIPRDRHAAYFAALAVTAASLERLAVEIRHLQRSEVQEAEEPFTEGQKGSSAMPHKRNPVLSENVTGLCRLVRGYAAPALENVALWHERDISHSSVERFIAPDATVTLHFALHRMAEVIAGLRVYPDNMRRNLQRTGGVFASQRVLLELTRRGLPRDDAYRIVQRCAHVAGEHLPFADALAADAEAAQHLSREDLAQLCAADAPLPHVEAIFARVFT